MTEQHPNGHVRAVLIPVHPAEPVVIEVLDATPAGRWAAEGGAQPEGMALDDCGTTRLSRPRCGRGRSGLR